MKGLSSRQYEIMSVLWSSSVPMTASQILAKNGEFNINTVQASLRSLMKKEYIKVADIVYSGTVLTRSYEPVLTREEYLESFLSPSGKSSLSGNAMLFAALVEKETDLDTLEQMEKIIAKTKQELEGKKEI